MSLHTQLRMFSITPHPSRTVQKLGDLKGQEVKDLFCIRHYDASHSHIIVRVAQKILLEDTFREGSARRGFLKRWSIKQLWISLQQHAKRFRRLGQRSFISTWGMKTLRTEAFTSVFASVLLIVLFCLFGGFSAIFGDSES